MIYSERKYISRSSEFQESCYIINLFNPWRLCFKKVQKSQVHYNETYKENGTLFDLI